MLYRLSFKHYLKFTASQELIRLKSNAPDKWEDKIIKSKFQSSAWQKGELVAEVAELNGQKAAIQSISTQPKKTIDYDEMKLYLSSYYS